MDDTNYYENMIAELRAERDALRVKLSEAQEAIAWANNSLFGSHSFFLSMHGGPADPHHLDMAIEELKSSSRNGYVAAQERDALAALLQTLSREAQAILYNADTYAESKRGLKHFKRLIDAALKEKP